MTKFCLLTVFFAIAVLSIVELYLLLLRSIAKDDKAMAAAKAFTVISLSSFVVFVATVIGVRTKGKIGDFDVSMLALWAALIPAMLCELCIAKFVRKKSALQYAAGK